MSNVTKEKRSTEENSVTVAIIDYGLGNLFNIQRCCQHVGLNTEITSDKERIHAADAIILPGVGAFARAMNALQELGLVDVIRLHASTGKPLLGICLGMQLLMTESSEFGRHKGLNLVPGSVLPFKDVFEGTRPLKVPQICWNKVFSDKAKQWINSPLVRMKQGFYTYFVHSFYIKPDDPGVVLATTIYGDKKFCSCIQKDNIFACQFHPERSGKDGIQIYRNWAQQVINDKKAKRNHYG
jgi:imidazole glycerol-phosphate synthase subunit HisH